jgi:protein-S-isoprenylcysteine O-methyltransferase Ste14
MERQKTNDWGMIIFRSITWLVLLFVILFVSAGRMDYWQGWVYFGITVFISIIGLVVFSHIPGLIQERIKPGPGTKRWDKVFMAFFVPLFISVVIVDALDVGRFHWTSPLPPWGYVVGYALFIFSYLFLFWSMWVNPFFSSVVRIQTDRGQTVIQSGPYQFVRHPGYVSGIVWILTNALILGSLWALIPAAVTAVLLIVRTSLEDRTLQNELSGYREYAQKVRYRLLPGVW